LFLFAPLLLAVAPFQYYRYSVLIAIMVLYLSFGPVGTDHEAYLDLFARNCDGNFVRSVEPGYQWFSFAVGRVFGCNSINIMLSIAAGMTALGLQNSFKRYVGGNMGFLMTSTIMAYLVTFQYAFNFRTGISSSLLILGFLYIWGSKRTGAALSFAAALNHVQTMPAGLLGLWVSSAPRLKILLLALGVAIFLVLFDYFNRFIIEALGRYLSGFAGSFRVSIVVYILIYIFTIFWVGKTPFSSLRVFFIFGLFVNIVFFWNSHISSRLTRPIEPLLLSVFLYCVHRFVRPRLSLAVTYLIIQLPGLAFFLLVLLNA